MDPYQTNTAQDTQEQSWWDKYGGAITGAATTAAQIGYNIYANNRQEQFNAKEAQKQRDYETLMSNTAYQRGYADMLKAGLNPNLAGGSGGASTPTGVQAQTAGMLPADVAGAMNNTAITSAQIENMKADTNLKNKNAGVSESQRVLNETETKLKPIITQAQIKLQNAQTETEKAQAKKEIEIAVQEAINNAWLQIYGHKPGEKSSNALGAMVQKMIAIGAGADLIVQKAINSVKAK